MARLTGMAQYISASRRSDMPRFFHRQFFEAWRRGFITYDGGYGRTYTVSLQCADVLGYIFWSKDYSRFIVAPEFADLVDQHNVLFHYTLNDCADLEPGVAPLAERLAALERLARLVGPQRIVWRYDPLCKYSLKYGAEKVNADPFQALLPIMRDNGIERCHFSFATLYGKMRSRKDIRFMPFSPQEKKRIAAEMLQAAAAHGIALYCCCNVELEGEVEGLKSASCVDDELLARTDRFGVHRSLGKKPTRKGCGCCESRDIGSYAWQCPHGCLYCYANPVLEQE